MNVVITGDLPFTAEIVALCQRHDLHTVSFSVETLLARRPDPAALKQADAVIELHHVSAPQKRRLLAAIGGATRSDALILTSTLTMSASEAAANVRTPERVIGCGVIPPLGDTGVVELALGLRSAPAALAQAEAFWRALGYEPVSVADGPGLVRARILCCIINEAASAVLEKVANPADIDTAMKAGANYPRGPLEWADYLGLDTVLAVVDGLFGEWGEDRYRPSPLLRRLVAAGRLGQRTGQGFYVYDRR